MPRRTDAHNPSDWLIFPASDLDFVRVAAEKEVSFIAARAKLAEALEKVLKAELIDLGWELEKTHDLDRLLQCLRERNTPTADQADPLCDALADAYIVDHDPGFDLDDPDWPKLRHLVRGRGRVARAREKRPVGVKPAIAVSFQNQRMSPIRPSS